LFIDKEPTEVRKQLRCKYSIDSGDRATVLARAFWTIFRKPRTFEPCRTKTNRFYNSFIPYSIRNFQQLAQDTTRLLSKCAV